MFGGNLGAHMGQSLNETWQENSTKEVNLFDCMLGLAQREIRDKLFEEKNSFSKIHDINRVSSEVRFWLRSAREHYTPL